MWTRSQPLDSTIVLRLLWMLICGAILTPPALLYTTGSAGASSIPLVDSQVATAQAQFNDSSHLYLYAGESIIKQVSGLQRVAVGDPKVADVTVLEGDIILINGVSAGYTTLLVWDDGGVSTYNLVVTAQPPMDLSSVERLLKPWNVQLSWWRQYLIVQGRLDSEQEKEAVESLLASLWEPVISLLSVKERPMDSEEEETFGKWDGSTDELRAQKIQQALGVPDVTVQVVKDLAILEGRVATEADSLRALEIARQFSPQVLNLMEVVEVDGEAAVTQGVVSVDALKDVLPSESTYENLGESSKTNRAAIIDDLRNLCAAWGYSLDSLGDVFILAGETQDRRRKDALLDLLTAHGLAFVDATSPKAQDATAEDLAELEDMLRELPGLWDVEVSKKGRRLLIAGWAEDPAVVHVAESLVRDYGASLGLEVSSLVKLRSSEKGKTAPSLIQKEIGIPGLVVRWVGDTLVLEGTLNSKEHQAAVALASQYSSSVVDLISDGSLSPLTIAQIKSLINSDDVLVKAVGNTVVLTGTVTSLEEKQAALALASAFGYPVVDALVIKDREIETPMLSESAIRRAIGIETVKVSLFNGTVLLEGTVEDRVDKIRAERIAETFGVPVVNLIEFRELPDEANRASELEDSLKWEQLVQEAAELGASLYIAASTPVLKGQVSPEAGAYLEALLDSELPHWINRLEILHPQEQLPSLDQIRSSLGNPAVECRYVGNTLILQGEVRSEEERQQIETIASKFGVPVESFITVAEDIQQIWVDVCMLELSYSDYRELGIDWKISLNNEEAVAGAKPPPGGFFQTEEGSKSAFSVVVGPLWLETHLHSLLRSGMARILASPSLLTENRQTAEFLAGGEIPVPGDVEGIGWKSYGVGLQVTPSILDNGTIHLQVEPEVSSLDWENAVQLDNALIPGVRTRRWRTQAAVEPGRTLIIGGLLSEEENIRERQVPILGELPILGTLFRNEVRTRVKTDLVVLVTPRIIDEKHLAGWEFKGDY